MQETRQKGAGPSRSGPLASVDGDYFRRDVGMLRGAALCGKRPLGRPSERRVYEFLRAGTQEQYVYGRRMLIRHPLLTWNEYVRIKTGSPWATLTPRPGRSRHHRPGVVAGIRLHGLRTRPGAAKVCPNCGWTMMTMRGKQPHCSSATCAEAVSRRFRQAGQRRAHDAFRLSRGVMHYISSPKARVERPPRPQRALGLKYEMWPLKGHLRHPDPSAGRLAASLPSTP